MKNLIKEFSSSIYNPSFYKQLNSKSLRSIWTYMLKIALLVASIYAVVAAIYPFLDPNLFGDVSGSTFAVSYIIGILTIFITMLLSIFVIWIVYGWILGIVILGVSKIFRNKISYAVSVKTGIYAMGLGVILMVTPHLPFSSWLGIIIPILIVLVNLKKK